MADNHTSRVRSRVSDVHTSSCVSGVGTAHVHSTVPVYSQDGQNVAQPTESENNLSSSFFGGWGGAEFSLILNSRGHLSLSSRVYLSLSSRVHLSLSGRVYLSINSRVHLSLSGRVYLSFKQ